MDDQDEALKPHVAGPVVGLSESTLAKMRCMGGGPPFIKLGRAVRYVRGDLLAWRNARRVRNTIEGSKKPHRLTEAA